jgi:hypothetical protein
MNYERQNILEALNKIPEDLKDTVYSVEKADKLVEIIKKHSLQSDKLIELGKQTDYVLLGLEHPSKFVGNLSQTLGIPVETAHAIAEDINHQIFRPVRESLRKIHGIGEDESRIGNQESGEERVLPIPPKPPAAVPEPPVNLPVRGYEEDLSKIPAPAEASGAGFYIPRPANQEVESKIENRESRDGEKKPEEAETKPSWQFVKPEEKEEKSPEKKPFLRHWGEYPAMPPEEESGIKIGIKNQEARIGNNESRKEEKTEEASEVSAGFMEQEKKEETPAQKQPEPEPSKETFFTDENNLDREKLLQEIENPKPTRTIPANFMEKKLSGPVSSPTIVTDVSHKIEPAAQTTPVQQPENPLLAKQIDPYREPLQ